MRLRLSTTVLALVGVLAACQAAPGTTSDQGSPEPSSAPIGSSTSAAATAAAGSPAVGSVSMTLATGWQPVELTDAGLRGVLATLGSTNPQLAAAVNQMLTSGQYRSLLLYTLGFDGPTFVGSANVSTFSASFDLDGLAPVMESQFKSVGASDVTVSHVSLPGGPALRITYSLKPQTAGSPAVTGHAYVFLAGSEAYQVTFSCNGPDPTACLGQADAMVQTFQVGS